MKLQYKQNGYHLIQNALSENEVTSLINEMCAFNNKINNYGIQKDDPVCKLRQENLKETFGC